MNLAATDLEILDRGIELTFQTELRCEVLDLTLCSKNLVDEIGVSHEPSLFDHRQIVFGLANVRSEAIKEESAENGLGLFLDRLRWLS